MILHASGLGHRFDQGWLFRNVEIVAAAGDRILVQGRNGAGKSTLLKCLAGLLIPREGEIRVSGPVGYSAIDLGLYPNLTAEEHLVAAAEFRGCPDEATKWLKNVGLEGSGGKPCRTFSTGMRSRLKLALALQHSPALLLLDEPTAALDGEGRDLVASVISGFPGAVVFSSNDPADGRFATHAIGL